MEGRRLDWLLAVCGALCMSGALASKKGSHHKHSSKVEVHVFNYLHNLLYLSLSIDLIFVRQAECSG